MALGTITRYVILEKYGTWYQFWTQLKNSKNAIPRTPKDTTHEKKKSRQTQKSSQNNCPPDISSLLTVKNEQFPAKHSVQNSHPRLSFSTFLRRISVRRPSNQTLENSNRHITKENRISNEAQYVNIMEINKVSRGEPLYANVNKQKNIKVEGRNNSVQENGQNYSNFSQKTTQNIKNHTHQEIDSVNKSYEQFAKRKKNIGMIPSTLNHHVQPEVIEYRKNEPNSIRPSSHENNKPSISDIIKKFNQK